jgi:hypothetical protein
MRRFMLIVAGVALLGGVWLLAPLPARAAAPIVRCVTTTGTAPPVATASGCAALYSTIASAIAAAAAGDTIYVFADAGATATNPTLYSTSVTISTDLTLVGVGAVALDGGGTNTVVTVGSGTAATLTGLTIQHGNADAASVCGGNHCGGGIASAGTLALIGVAVANNSAGNVNGGGARTRSPIPSSPGTARAMAAMTRTSPPRQRTACWAG